MLDDSMSDPTVLHTCVVCGGDLSRLQQGGNLIDRCCSYRCCGSLSAVKQGYALWTSAEDELATTLVADGATWRDISNLLGFSIFAVRINCDRLGLTRPTAERWSPQEEALLREVALHMWNVDIAELLGRSARAISGKLKKLGVKRSTSWYLDRGLTFHACPPELQEVILLQHKLRRSLREEEHRGSA